MSPVRILKRVMSVFIIYKLAKGGCLLSRFHLTRCSYFLGQCRLSEFTLAGPLVWIFYLVFYQTSDSPQGKWCRFAALIMIMLKATNK